MQRGSGTPVTNNQTPVTSIAIAVVEHNDRFLIGPRPAGVPLAGYWEFPGGKLQANESAEEAAARECLEETGIAVRVADAYPTAACDYPHGRLTLHFFAAAPLDPAAVPRLPFHWVARAELANHRFPPANDELLRLLLAG